MNLKNKIQSGSDFVTIFPSTQHQLIPEEIQSRRGVMQFVKSEFFLFQADEVLV